MKRYIIVLLSLLILTQLLGCKERSIGLFNDSACKAPCWREIRIGENKDDVLVKLSHMADVEQNTISISGSNRPFIEDVINWKFDNGSGHGSIALKDNLVTAFSFTLARNVLLSELITLYGEPEFITLEKMQLDGTYLAVHIIYISQGICLDVHSSLLPFVNPKTYKIKPSTKVEVIYYVDPMISNWETQVGCQAGVDKEHFSREVENWTGYGSYEIYGFEKGSK